MMNCLENYFYSYPVRKKSYFDQKLSTLLLCVILLFCLVGNVPGVEQNKEVLSEKQAVQRPAMESNVIPKNDINKSIIANKLSEEKKLDKTPGRVGFSDFIVTFISLLLILVLIIFVAWLVKRSGFIMGGSNQLIRLLGSVPVGQKERVALIQVGDEQILIGVAAGNVQKLHVLKEPVEVKATSSSPINNNLFALALKKYQQKTKLEK